MKVTIGQLLGAADRKFDREGGYKATAWGTKNRIDLIYQSTEGVDVVISSAEWPRNIAAEDIAGQLLASEIGEQEARKRYFVVTLR